MQNTFAHHTATPWYRYAVYCGVPKFTTIPIPAVPVLETLWVFPYPCDTLVTLQPIAQAVQQCTAKSAALRARLAQLEADRNKVPPSVLFVDQIVIDKA